jgi:hypothetical protein
MDFDYYTEEELKRGDDIKVYKAIMRQIKKASQEVKNWPKSMRDNIVKRTTTIDSN